ncbi:uncharacterized protein MONBRDRAFT_6792 [Monosiga brevicollis MX1]|uniref:Uncharacterized protein n=1 Tax=Monosiga brevicollis TaxID=81824 RepID=A9UVB6_MONBE|nr:uncharacterized protein MONBRDRAFT_6792 [Monosiga brevicollis MX1]EDQ91054.1 predicted protein [Monosiga brevicollis MX1]|eukprot:XP_001744351.1 hypothetical protein [Monosiga brevicollis MX1]
MTSGSWEYLGSILNPSQRPPGVLFRPKVVYNPNNARFVLWIRIVPLTSNGQALNWTAEGYYATDATSPLGPFVVDSKPVQVSEGNGGDYGLFVDAGTDIGYVIYTSHATNVRMVVEQLAPDFLSSTYNRSAVFGPASVESPALVARHGFYYAFFGHTCCYCLAGSNSLVYVSTDPLGPYDYLTDVVGNASGIHAQLNYVAQTGFLTSPDKAPLSLLWTGTRWGSSPRQQMRSDYQYWEPLVFDDSQTPPMPQPLAFQNQFNTVI